MAAEDCVLTGEQALREGILLSAKQLTDVIDRCPYSNTERHYIYEVLNPALRPLVRAVVESQPLPPDPLTFMIRWMRAKLGLGEAATGSRLRAMTVQAKTVAKELGGPDVERYQEEALRKSLAESALAASRVTRLIAEVDGLAEAMDEMPDDDASRARLKAELQRTLTEASVKENRLRAASETAQALLATQRASRASAAARTEGAEGQLPADLEVRILPQRGQQRPGVLTAAVLPVRPLLRGLTGPAEAPEGVAARRSLRASLAAEAKAIAAALTGELLLREAAQGEEEVAHHQSEVDRTALQLRRVTFEAEAILRETTGPEGAAAKTEDALRKSLLEARLAEDELATVAAQSRALLVAAPKAAEEVRHLATDSAQVKSLKESLRKSMAEVAFAEDKVRSLAAEAQGLLNDLVCNGDHSGDLAELKAGLEVSLKEATQTETTVRLLQSRASAAFVEDGIRLAPQVASTRLGDLLPLALADDLGNCAAEAKRAEENITALGLQARATARELHELGEADPRRASLEGRLEHAVSEASSTVEKLRGLASDALAIVQALDVNTEGGSADDQARMQKVVADLRDAERKMSALLLSRKAILQALARDSAPVVPEHDIEDTLQSYFLELGTAAAASRQAIADAHALAGTLITRGRRRSMRESQDGENEDDEALMVPGLTWQAKSILQALDFDGKGGISRADLKSGVRANVVDICLTEDVRKAMASLKLMEERLKAVALQARSTMEQLGALDGADSPQRRSVEEDLRARLADLGTAEGQMQILTHQAKETLEALGKVPADADVAAGGPAELAMEARSLQEALAKVGSSEERLRALTLEAQSILQAMDTNGDSGVDMAEFKEGVRRHLIDVGDAAERARSAATEAESVARGLTRLRTQSKVVGEEALAVSGDPLHLAQLQEGARKSLLQLGTTEERLRNVLRSTRASLMSLANGEDEEDEEDDEEPLEAERVQDRRVELEEEARGALGYAVSRLGGAATSSGDEAEDSPTRSRTGTEVDAARRQLKDFSGKLPTLILEGVFLLRMDDLEGRRRSVELFKERLTWARVAADQRHAFAPDGTAKLRDVLTIESFETGFDLHLKSGRKLAFRTVPGYDGTPNVTAWVEALHQLVAERQAAVRRDTDGAVADSDSGADEGPRREGAGPAPDLPGHKVETLVETANPLPSLLKKATLAAKWIQRFQEAKKEAAGDKGLGDPLDAAAWALVEEAHGRAALVLRAAGDAEVSRLKVELAFRALPETDEAGRRAANEMLGNARAQAQQAIAGLEYVRKDIQSLRNEVEIEDQLSESTRASLAQALGQDLALLLEELPLLRLHHALSDVPPDLLEQLIAINASGAVHAQAGLPTPMHWFAEKGRRDMIDFLLRQQGGETLLTTRDAQGRTPLFYARRANQAGCVAFLTALSSDIDPNMPDVARPDGLLDRIPAAYRTILETIERQGMHAIRWKGGQTLLHTAAAKGNLELCEYLVKLGADPKGPDNKGHTPIDLAEQHGHKHIVDALRSNHSKLHRKKTAWTFALSQNTGADNERSAHNTE